MAEGGFEFSVSVPVTADLTQFRQQLGAELQSVGQTPAVVPVQAGGGAGGALAVRPATAAVAAAAPTLAAATNAAVAQAAAGGGALVPTGNAALAQAAMQAGVPAVVNTATGQVVAGAAGGAGFVTVPNSLGATGARGGFRGGVGGLGILGWGTAFHAAGNLAMAHMEHDRAVRESDGSASALIAADITYQQRAGQSIPIAGHLALAIREAVTGDVEYTHGMARAAELQDAATGSRRETFFARRGISAGFGAGGEIERARIEQERTVGRLTDERGRITSDLSNLPEQVTGAEYARVAAKRMQLRSIDEQIDLARETFGRDETRLRGRQGIERLNIGARAAEFQDAASGLNPSDAERRAIIRRQSIEVRQANLEDRGLLPDLVQQHGAELRAFDAQRVRAERSRDIESSAVVEAANLRAAGRPFDAELAEQRGRYNRRMEGARGNLREQSRIAGEEGATRTELIAAHDRQQQVLQGELDRNPFAALAGITDPLAKRLFIQRTTDAQELRTAGLRAREEVTGEEAAGREKSADALAIQRRAEIEQTAGKKAGLSTEDQATILRTGLNELQAYQRQLRRRSEAGSVSEMAPGTYAPGTGGEKGQQEPVVQALKNVQTSIDTMNASLNALLNAN